MGVQAARGVIYDALGNLVACSDEITVESGQAGAWVDLPFPEDRGVALTAGTYFLGLHAGATANVLRRGVVGTASLALGRLDPDTYSDLPAATIGGGPTAAQRLAIYALVIFPYVPLATMSERQIAGLPFTDASAFFGGATGPDQSTAIRAQCGWHGTRFAEEEGAFAIVKLGGLLSDYVGERVKVEHDGRAVYVYVYDERDIMEDISLTRRAFLEISMATAEVLDATVTAMGSGT